MSTDCCALLVPVRSLQVPELSGQYHAVHVLLRRKIGNILLFGPGQKGMVELFNRHRGGTAKK